MNTGNNYANMLSSYGFNDKDYFETYPEERRNWRKNIKQHVDEAMGITDEDIKERDDNLTKRLMEARDNINENVNEKSESIIEHVTTEVSGARDSVEEYVSSIAGITAQQARNGNTISKKIGDVQTTANDIKTTVTTINTHMGTMLNETVAKRLKDIEDNTVALLNRWPL